LRMQVTQREWRLRWQTDKDTVILNCAKCHIRERHPEARWLQEFISNSLQ
jgi:hypothetical protein